MNIKVVIPSHKRAWRVTTTKHITNSMICVPDSQKAEYEEHNTDIEIIAHPDSVVGLSNKRQWIYEKFGDVFMVDDDCIGIKRLHVPQDSEYALNPNEAYEWINNNYHACKEFGLKLFGFNQDPTPFHYSGRDAFRMSGFVQGGAIGLLKDDKLHFPNVDNSVGEDAYISALNAYYYRMAFIDLRLHFSFPNTGVDEGGCSTYRSSEVTKQTYIYLRKKFGSAIIQNKPRSYKVKVDKWDFWMVTPF